jgi:hypothetical protein
MTPFKGAQIIMNEPSKMFDNYPFTQQAFITTCNAFEATNPNSTIGDVVKFLKELDRLGYKIGYK